MYWRVYNLFWEESSGIYLKIIAISTFCVIFFKSQGSQIKYCNNDIAGDIMNKRKLQRIKRQIDILRSRPNNIRSTELSKLAKSLHRRRFDRGKEPTYVSDILPKSRPISIPNHPGAMSKFTAINILDQLEQDIFEIEEQLEE